MAMSKLDCQRRHAKKRFLQRHGLDFNRNVRRFFEESIKKGTATFVYKQTGRITVWDVEYEGKIYRVIYDKQRHNIVTVLDNDENGVPVDVYEEAPTRESFIQMEREFEIGIDKFLEERKRGEV